MMSSLSICVGKISQFTACSALRYFSFGIWWRFPSKMNPTEDLDSFFLRESQSSVEEIVLISIYDPPQTSNFFKEINRPKSC